MADFDLLIIGTGSGNTILSPEFDDWRVAIVERDVFGGTCLNRGCIPSKMLVLPANRIVEASEADKLGVHFAAPTVDWSAITSRVFGRIDPIAEGGAEYREGLPNVTVLRGDAYIADARHVQVTAPDGSQRVVSTDRMVLAAGARPRIPDIEGLAETPFLTSDDVMRIPEVPEHLVIIGGGFIAAEMGHVFAAMGSRVSVVHRGARMLRHEDVEVSTRFTEEFAKRVFLHLEAEVTHVRHDGQFTLTIDRCEADGRSVEEELVCDALLVTTGRIPNGQQLGVLNAGVTLDVAGYVETDPTMATGVDGIWALGDITNPYQLKHLANLEAKVVSHNLLHPEDLRVVDQRVVPHAVFSYPEIGAVGPRQVDLDAMGVEYRVGRCDYAGVAYGWALEDLGGFAKVLVCPETGRLLGGHVIGHQAATLAQQLAQAMQFDIDAERLAREQIWCHPALPEVLENALLDAIN